MAATTSDLTAAGIGAVVDKLQQLKREYDDVRVKCGIIGVAGSGKSTLINAIAGEKIAAVSATGEQTMEPQEFHSGGIVFVDLPGCGTPQWPKATYLQRLNLSTYDCFILVTATRFFECDAYLFQELAEKLKKPCFVVRNKFDQAIDDGRFDKDMGEEQVRQEIIANVSKNLEPARVSRVYLIAARHPTRYDLPVLLQDIYSSLHGLKRERFVADMAVLCDEALNEKKKVAEKLVGIYSGLAAANACNPIPGLDIGVDAGLLLNLSREIIKIYGLSQSYEDFLRSTLGERKVQFMAVQHIIARIGSRYLTEEAILYFFRKMASRVAVKQAAKWVPFVGTLVAAGIAFKMTFGFGETLLDDCESGAKEVLALLANSNMPLPPPIG